MPSPRVVTGRAARARDRVQAPGRDARGRNEMQLRTTGTAHFLRIDQPLERGMKKRLPASEAGIACVLRIVTVRGKRRIEIEIDDAAAMRLAAKLVRGAVKPARKNGR